MKKLFDWDKVKENLTEARLPIIEGYTSSPLVQLADAHGLQSEGTYVDLEGVEGLNAKYGLIVTYKQAESNNGVYVFCVQEDSSVGMFVLIPSTISKSPMINRVTGDITSVLTGLDLPLLTTFDKTEIVGFVIVNTIIEPLMDTLSIPHEQRQSFIHTYLPRFMANVTRQYVGDPELREEVIEMEPTFVKQMLSGDIPVPQDSGADIGAHTDNDGETSGEDENVI